MNPSPLIIWRFKDGKPGHEQQSLGLCDAIQRLQLATIIDFDVRQLNMGFFAWLDWLFARFNAGQPHPKPHLLIGAGHSTHLPMLAAKRAFGGRIVVLMKPSLPLTFFDLAIVPEHDEVSAKDNVLTSKGALNPMRPAPKIKGSVLFLFGGSTQEGSLFSASILQEVDFILKEVEGDYQLSNSRRTPDYLTQQLRQKYGTHFMAWQDCPSGWLREQMAVTETVWVTNDSVSMIYEALSAGCRVGLLSYEENRKKTRVSKGIAQLAKDNVVKPFLAFKGMCGRYDGPTMINPFSDEQLKKHPLKAVQFQEADRIAKVMQERGFLPLKQREDGL